MSLIHLVVILAVVAIVISLVYWILSQIPLPPTVRQVINIALVVITALVVIGLLLNLTGADVRL
jgi:heme A synthase